MKNLNAIASLIFHIIKYVPPLLAHVSPSTFHSQSHPCSSFLEIYIFIICYALHYKYRWPIFRPCWIQLMWSQLYSLIPIINPICMNIGISQKHKNTHFQFGTVESSYRNMRWLIWWRHINWSAELQRLWGSIDIDTKHNYYTV